MRKRCLNPNAPEFPQYGGRGISICPEWLDSYERFLADMGPRSHGMTLDRIDPNGNYEPSNCRWASLETQNRNRRTCHYVEFNGQRHCIMEWAERVGLEYHVIKYRISRGWSAEAALLTPKGKYSRAAVARKEG